jgi:hypothetical protein
MIRNEFFEALEMGKKAEACKASVAQPAFGGSAELD